jgi:hypothetical protein
MALPFNCVVTMGDGDEDKIGVITVPDIVLMPKTTLVSNSAPSVFTHQEI